MVPVIIYFNTTHLDMALHLPRHTNTYLICQKTGHSIRLPATANMQHPYRQEMKNNVNFLKAIWIDSCSCFTLTVEVNDVIYVTTDGRWAGLRDGERHGAMWRSDPAYASESACPPHCRVMRAGSGEPPCPWWAASWLGKRTQWTDTLLGGNLPGGRGRQLRVGLVGVVSKYARTRVCLCARRDAGTARGAVSLLRGSRWTRGGGWVWFKGFGGDWQEWQNFSGAQTVLPACFLLACLLPPTVTC